MNEVIENISNLNLRNLVKNVEIYIFAQELHFFQIDLKVLIFYCDKIV